MRQTTYSAPTTLDAALSLLQSGGASARMLAGGTDLIIQARARAREVGAFIDAKRIPEMMAIDFDEHWRSSSAKQGRLVLMILSR